MNAIHHRFSLVSLLAAAVMLSACSSINPFYAGQTPEQKAFAVVGSFNILQGQAVKIAEDGTIPTGIRRAVIDAEAAAKPAVVELAGAVREYQVIHDQLVAGETSEERLRIASEQLAHWTDTALKRVASFNAAVGEAKP